MRRTKIIATLGPASHDPEIVTRLAREGVDIFRINYSHGRQEQWKEAVEYVRQAEQRLGKYLPVIGDLQGPTIRTGILDEPLVVKRGDTVHLVNRDKASASQREIPIPNRKVFDVLEEGDIVVIGAGALWLRVDEIHVDYVRCTVLNDAVCKSEQTLAVLGKDIPVPCLTEKDIQDIEFSIEAGVDYLALSFVRTAEDVRVLKDILQDKKCSDIKIIAKIETKSAVENLDSIIREADAVLVARGDLAMYFPLEKIPKIQELIVKKALYYAKPVIVATQLLESMVEKPFPTRSEVVDISIAVKQGADALMLAEETAVGKYPVEAVKWLRKIIEEAEQDLNVEIQYPEHSVYDRFAHSVAQVANTLKAKILIYTRGGTTARRVCRFRPRTQIYVATSSIKTARQLQLLWGVKPVHVSEDGTDVWSALDKLLKVLLREGEVSMGDIVVMTGGLREETTNLMKVLLVE